MHRLIAFAFLICCVIAAPLHAQDQQRIVSLVNDEVISLRDLNERMRIIMATTRLPDNNPEILRAVREQALRSLIDDRLQMQEAKRRNITTNQQDVDSAVAAVERQMNIPAGRFEEYVRRSGVDPAAAINQIRSELTWSRMVRARVGAQITITEQEIDEAIAKLRANAGQTEELISEILVPMDNPDQEAPQRQLAERIIEQIRGGANFPALARQFSRGTTAANGGDVGWIQRGTLSEETEAAIAKLNKGEISAPIRTVGGWQIVALRDRRRISLPGIEENRVTLKQLLLPLPTEAPQAEIDAAMAKAREARNDIRSCDDVETVAAKYEAPGSGSLGTLRMGDLPESFRQAVAPLTINETSQPVRASRAVHIFTLCAKQEAAGLNRNEIRQGILARRAELMAQRYIRELRRDATIEFR
ncbi:MAG: peptidylprolyl isomerase [Ferrovibrio sp.]|uniref:peptidylprolyl isomerase n=1 Tax=Ferrovibrio sp. TaxID=1917215 RepID=UPI00262DDB1F|nr:peptidylprolyl isomerase [Ferrovibrio sp.]MCW0235187.1 peptidylprolyl isomerase [Ferrovibrio sp.]